MDLCPKQTSLIHLVQAETTNLISQVRNKIVFTVQKNLQMQKHYKNWIHKSRELEFHIIVSGGNHNLCMTITALCHMTYTFYGFSPALHCLSS